LPWSFPATRICESKAATASEFDRLTASLETEIASPTSGGRIRRFKARFVDGARRYYFNQIVSTVITNVVHTVAVHPKSSPDEFGRSTTGINDKKW
jgi:hypothetical protein